ncbi:MAG: hypothetical protein PHE93_03830 [Clostridia bacterium]|nr:hypothetical protein [Clostridia bacterium]
MTEKTMENIEDEKEKNESKKIDGKNTEILQKNTAEIAQILENDTKESTEISIKKQTVKREEKPQLTPAQQAEKKRKLRETENFKKKYFEYYDDIKISHREDW